MFHPSEVIIKAANSIDDDDNNKSTNNTNNSTNSGNTNANTHSNGSNNISNSLSAMISPPILSPLFSNSGNHFNLDNNRRRSSSWSPLSRRKKSFLKKSNNFADTSAGSSTSVSANIAGNNRNTAIANSSTINNDRADALTPNTTTTTTTSAAYYGLNMNNNTSSKSLMSRTRNNSTNLDIIQELQQGHQHPKKRFPSTNTFKTSNQEGSRQSEGDNSNSNSNSDDDDDEEEIEQIEQIEQMREKLLISTPKGVNFITSADVVEKYASTIASPLSPPRTTSTARHNNQYKRELGEEGDFLLAPNAAGYPHNLSPTNSVTDVGEVEHQLNQQHQQHQLHQLHQLNQQHQRQHQTEVQNLHSLLSVPSMDSDKSEIKNGKETMNTNTNANTSQSITIDTTSGVTKKKEEMRESTSITPRASGNNHRRRCQSLNMISKQSQLNQPNKLNDHQQELVHFPLPLSVSNDTTISSLTDAGNAYNNVNENTTIHSNSTENNTDVNNNICTTPDINLYPPNFNNITSGGGIEVINVAANAAVASTLMATSATFTDDTVSTDGHQNSNSRGLTLNGGICGEGPGFDDDNDDVEQHTFNGSDYDNSRKLDIATSNDENDDESDLISTRSPSSMKQYNHQRQYRHHHNHRRLYSNDSLRRNSSNDYDVVELYSDDNNDSGFDTTSSPNNNGRSLIMQSNSNDYSHESKIHRQSSRRHKQEKPKGRIETFVDTLCQRVCWFCPTIPRPSWSRVSSAVVRYAPCFFCADKLETSATDRMLLARLNVLCAIFSLGQFAVGVFTLIVFLSESVVDRGNSEEEVEYVREALTPNLWMMNGCLLMLAIVGLFIFCTMIITIPKIKRVNLGAAIRYMWILYWVLPLQILFVIALFDYHQVTDVWIKHWWSSPSMAWFRQIFCEPGTANTKCAIPVHEGLKENSQWCELNFNASDCQSLRDAAIEKMEASSYFFIYSNAIAGAVLIILLLLALGLLEGIISAPIVQRSKESNISLWLTLPIIGCFGGGAALLFTPHSLLSNESGASLFWIGLCYLVTGVTFTISALLGWFISAKTVLNLRDKTHKEIAVYLFIMMMILTIFAVGSIFAVSLVYTLNFVNIFDEKNRGRIACYIDAAKSCTGCCADDELCGGLISDQICPEWTSQDVSKIIQTQLKQSATLAAIFFLYAFSALRFGFSLRASVSKYEIDYV